MKSFQDYVSLKEVAGSVMGKQLFGTSTSLTPDEMESFQNVLMAMEEILAGDRRTAFLRMLNSLSSVKRDFDPAVLARAAKKILKSMTGEDGLGDSMGEPDQIAQNSADDQPSNF